MHFSSHRPPAQWSYFSQFCLLFFLLAIPVRADTVALWLFDEQAGLYPSCVMSDAASGDFPLVIGLGGQLREGKFGRGLEPTLQPDQIVATESNDAGSGGIWTGETGDLVPNDARPLLSWSNAQFCGLMTRGESHLRQEVNFGSATKSRLNLGDFDWTLEFWFLPTTEPGKEGVVLEMGTGPRGEDSQVTRLLLQADRQGFTLQNGVHREDLIIASDGSALGRESSDWCHLAFVFDAANRQLRHYVDGRLQTPPRPYDVQSLPHGEHDYLSVGRDGRWERPLGGRLDELRISDSQVYRHEFAPPGSFSRLYRTGYAAPPLHHGPPLLFPLDRKDAVVALGNRKHVFIDDAILAHAENVTFAVNPPRIAECVMESTQLGNHLVVFEGRDGLVRLYGNGPRKSLAVFTSKDGIIFEKPDLGTEFLGQRNVVIEDPVGLGTLFEDPNAPSEERMKYFSGYRGRGQFVYSSPDGYRFTRNETSALPMRGASQSIVFYDDQQQQYVGFHRSDMLRTVGGKTKRTFVRTTTTDIMRPWPFQPVSGANQIRLGKHRRLGTKIPYFVDNGPLTPPGFGIEYPTGFEPDETMDPVATDVYVPKCIKYPWAPDTYLAFPIMYFHYHGDGPVTRRTLGLPERNRGSGPLETQIATSRDGIQWHRYPRPAYIGIGKHLGKDLKRIYIAHGMVRRGDEIWQYYLGSPRYHSPWEKESEGDSVFRAVQRIDGFVSANTPYTGGELTTRLLTFDGGRLILNIDTDAAGFAQVGLLDENGDTIDGFGVDDCIYINGDFTATEVEWLKKGKDVSELAGKPIMILIRSRGTRLYSMKFES